MFYVMQLKFRRAFHHCIVNRFAILLFSFF
jgi:hypothetical protein